MNINDPTTEQTNRPTNQPIQKKRNEFSEKGDVVALPTVVKQSRIGPTVVCLSMGK